MNEPNFFCIFAPKIIIKMKKHIKNIGIALIFLGIVLFVVSFVAGWNYINAVQLAALAMVVGGAVLHVMYIKKQSEY